MRPQGPCCTSGDPVSCLAPGHLLVQPSGDSGRFITTAGSRRTRTRSARPQGLRPRTPAAALGTAALCHTDAKPVGSPCDCCTAQRPPTPHRPQLGTGVQGAAHCSAARTPPTASGSAAHVSSPRPRPLRSGRGLPPPVTSATTLGTGAPPPPRPRPPRSGQGARSQQDSV